MQRRNQVRIIGGRFRSRNIFFPDSVAIRPTPNRVRETLFNWLMPFIQGAVCLDMFAGSGSLSFEALSRGAASVVLWEPESAALKALKENAIRLQVDPIDIKPIRFPHHLPEYSQPCFDIVFIDPPFYKGYVERACNWLVKANCLKQDALIYIETEASLKPLPIPIGWEIFKSQKAGDVCFYLVGRIKSYDYG